MWAFPKIGVPYQAYSEVIRGRGGLSQQQFLVMTGRASAKENLVTCAEAATRASTELLPTGMECLAFRGYTGLFMV